MVEKQILDACCGGKMFWYNKHHPKVLYVDNRACVAGHNPYRKKHTVEPDRIMARKRRHNRKPITEKGYCDWCNQEREGIPVKLNEYDKWQICDDCLKERGNKNETRG